MSPARPVRPRMREAFAPSSTGTAVQLTLEEIGTPLREVTFVVVDLETTGTRSADSAITEIGAVKVRGGEILGEFQTLVDPGGPVPAMITVLTGITTAMVAAAPRIEQVLPSFLEFLGDAVLVAHNAPFDVGFLRAAARATGHEWPPVQVVDTVRLARRVVLRDEAPNHRLGTLAHLFGASTTPDHRALSDARATVDVLHALVERLAGLGVTHLEDLATAADPVPDPVRRKKHLADHLPSAPGVYLFRGPGDEVLYVGTSQDLRTRVRSYFTAAEKRSRITEMLMLAQSVTPVVCATTLEAQVRELRLIAEHAPRYNRRSRFPERMPWLRLEEGARPRLTVVRATTPGAAHIGPFSSRTVATQARDALLTSLERPEHRGVARRDPLGPQEVVALRHAMLVDPSLVVDAHTARLARLAAAERYEEAAHVRDRLAAFVRGAARAQRFAPLASCPELVAARRTDEGGWEVVLVRHGRLAGTTASPPGVDPQPAIEALRLSAEHVTAPVSPATAAHPEETDLVLAWLAEPGVRLVGLAGESPWASPVHGAEGHGNARTAERVREAGASQPETS